MMLLLLWGCGFGLGEEAAPVAEPAATATAAAQPAPPAFDVLPLGVELILEPQRFQAMVAPYKLGPVLARRAVGVTYNTDVMVDQIAAVRTGAELGALMVEAGHQEISVVQARLARIHAGLDAIQPGGPVLEQVARLSAAVDAGITGDAWVQVLQAHHAPIQDNVAAHLGDDMVPLLLAGAWMQGALLAVQGIQETGQLEAGPLLLNRPLVGGYFDAWVAQAGTDIFPAAAFSGIQESLGTLRTLTTRDPMTPADAAAIQDTLEGLLGMI